MARYADAVAWIALNDEPEDLDDESIAGYATVALVADTWGKSDARVARDVQFYRLAEVRRRARESRPTWRTAYSPIDAEPGAGGDAR